MDKFSCFKIASGIINNVSKPTREPTFEHNRDVAYKKLWQTMAGRVVSMKQRIRNEAYFKINMI